MKKILLTLLLLLAACTSVYAAEDSRWVPLYNNHNKVYAYYDHKTPEYDKKTGNITLWVKREDSDNVVWLTKYQANINDKSYIEIYGVTLGPGEKHREGALFNPEEYKYSVIPDSSFEKIVNLACDDLRLKPFLGVKNHKWLFLKEAICLLKPCKHYICEDTYKYDKKHQIVSVHCKAVPNDNPLIRTSYEAKVNLTTREINYSSLYGKRIAAPDTLDEAIYNAAKEMVNKHENH